MKTSAQLSSLVLSEVAALESQLETAQAETRALRRAVDGNALLIRRDGFSRPIFIEPVYSPYLGSSLTSDCRAFPHYFETYEHVPGQCRDFRAPDEPFSRVEAVSYTRLRFRDTHRCDGFGRRVYEEI